MDRRGFLRGGVAAVFGQSAHIGRTRPANPGVVCSWQEARRHLVDSGLYRQVERASGIDWLAVQLNQVPDNPTLHVQLIDLDLHPEQETALIFPVPPLWLGFEVIGPVPYEMRADWSRGNAGLSVDVWFARPTALELWQGQRGGDIVVLTLPD
jgi:hypothetical protein